MHHAVSSISHLHWESFCKASCIRKNSILFSHLKTNSISWWQMELNFSGIVSNSKLSKEKNGRKAFGTAAFIPSPPLACRAMKNIVCELWDTQHLCLLLCDHLSTWPKHHRAKSILQVAGPATQTLSHYYCQDEGLCYATGQWHFGYPPWDSCTKPDPATICSCSLG